MRNLVLLTVLVNSVSCLDPNQLEVSTAYGPVRGSEGTSRSGRAYYSFRGIPFAKPPVGDLRWQNPQTPDSWTEPLDATQRGPYCAQRNYIFFEKPPVEGQEDCLYVNVYTPQIDSNDPLPVVVSIPYGGFFMGRGSDELYGPEFLMDKNIVLVSANYRLGILGFLSTLDDSAPGNFGLKDQVLALKWVQENIHNFGGDKNRVTIMGQSAGATSVHYHILSPLSKGLFHRAIGQSGSALMMFSQMYNRYVPKVLSKQASLVNCSDFVGDSGALMKCMKDVPVNDLLETQDAFKEFSVFPFSTFWPVVEKATADNPEPFFTVEPLEYIFSGEFAHVPWIMGNVADEGLLVEGKLRNAEIRDAINKKFNYIISNIFMQLPRSTNNVDALFDNIKAFYMRGENLLNISNPFNFHRFVEALSDRWFVYGSYQSVMLHSVMGHRPIWYYRFNYRGAYTYGDLLSFSEQATEYDLGVRHGDDLLYLFQTPMLFPELKPFDKTVSALLIDMWTNFIINGDPNPTAQDYTYPAWSPLNIYSFHEMKNDNLCYLNIEGSYKKEVLSLTPTCGMYKERMVFWASQDLFENFQGLDGY